MIKKTITDNKNILFILFAYTILLLFFCSKMSPLYPLNEWSDINLYFNMGKAMFNGRTIYTEAFDHKGPLIFFIYGIGYLISNTSFLGMYLIEVILWTIMLFAVYFTARLYLDKVYALIVALALPLLILSHTQEGGSAEEFIAIFESVSLLFFIRYFKDKNVSAHNPKIMLVHGLMCCMTLFIKMNLVIFWFFPLLAIFINLILKKEYRNLIYNALAFIAGVLIIALPVCIYFIANNALTEAWDVYVVLNRSYARIGSALEIIELLAVRFYLRLRFETIEFLIILLGAFFFPYKYIGNRLGAISISLSFISLFTFIFITPGYVYYYDIPYTIFGIPGLIVLCKYIRLGSGKSVYIIAASLFLVLSINLKSFFGLQINEVIKRETPKTYVDEFEEIITKEKNPTLMNLGLDLGNSLFTRLNIVPNVKYFISPNLRYDFYPVMREEQSKYIENKDIQFFIICGASEEYNYYINLPALQNNYTMVYEAFDSSTKVYHYLYKRND